MIFEVECIGRDSKTGMTTVFLLKYPLQTFRNSPSGIDFSFSMQYTFRAALQRMEAKIYRFVYEMAAGSELDVSNYENVWSFRFCMFDNIAVSCVKKAAKEMWHSYDKICSRSKEFIPISVASANDG